jgi:bacteriorhodopsin
METLLSAGQYQLVYNAFSFTFATMAAATLFLWLGRSQVSPTYRTALTISGLVTAIAAYHYFRIFESWEQAYTFKDGAIVATGYAFNDAYRYVDWLLTVPLLLIELILVMGLSSLMIVLGYPGEIADNNTTRMIWGTLSSIPFCYIMWQLFAGLGASIAGQPDNVRDMIKTARLLTFASWGFYPIVYMIPYTSFSGATVETAVQIGYTIADLIAKAGVGVLIYLIARRKSEAEMTSGKLAHA